MAVAGSVLLSNPMYTSAAKWLAAVAWATASGSSSDITVAPRMAQLARKSPGQGTETAELADDDPALGDRAEPGPEPLTLAHGGDARARRRSGSS